MDLRGRAEERILIVDDEIENINLLETMLRCLEYEHIFSIQDPSEVVDRYKFFKPDLILLDLIMPKMDGFQVIEQLMALQDPLLPPIIVLTANREKDALVRSLSAGARDFIKKPFQLDELLMRVRNLLDAHLAHKLLHDQKSALEEMVQQRTEELNSTRLAVVRRLSMAAEYRDEETGAHIIRMSQMSALLAQTIGWSYHDCDLMLNASPMHDIGKIGIPDAILLKPGKLDAQEWTIMKTHATIGGKLLEGDDSDLIKMAREIALSHHEKWDGSGYPSGLKGEEIPMAGRIAAVADVFDALTSPRPYKLAWSLDDAVALIKESAGGHFDPRLVQAFMDVLPTVLDIQNANKDR